ncbi:MAG TPA: cell division protein ZapA [Caulobacterales bacterium]|nr:cell division protein ZapA [Caulobacterales bacterium]
MTALRILEWDLSLDCPLEQERRLQDLARALEARLAQLNGREPEAVKRLLLVALALMDETQAAGAALVRAHNEIERLSDQLADANAVQPLARKPAAEPSIA